MATTSKASRPAAKKTTKSTSGKFTAEERAAMKERAAELKADKSREAGEKAIREKIAKMPDEDRVLAEKVHEIVTKVAPELIPRTWYGMPAYSKGDDVLCFFQDAGKFKARYSMLGFSDKANLDKGSMWPVYYALTKITATVEKELRALVKQAIS